LDLINRAGDAALNLNAIWSKIAGMTDEEAKAALQDERRKTQLLLEVTHQI
jgi:hypothetical protein